MQPKAFSCAPEKNLVDLIFEAQNFETSMVPEEPLLLVPLLYQKIQYEEIKDEGGSPACGKHQPLPLKK